VEAERPENERGYHIHPELFGPPPEKSIERARNSGPMRQLQAEKEKAPAASQPQ